MKTTVINQDCVLPGTPHEVFEVWMDSAKHASLTNSEAKIDHRVGGSFTTFDGWATGTTLELIADKKIVQRWRAAEWPDKHFSTITILLEPVSQGTRINFTQTDVPSSFAKNIAQGWQDYYWSPMKAARRME